MCWYQAMETGEGLRHTSKCILGLGGGVPGSYCHVETSPVLPDLLGLVFVLATPHSMWDLHSLTRHRTCIHYF